MVDMTWCNLVSTARLDDFGEWFCTIIVILGINRSLYDSTMRIHVLLAFF